jgi:hypothetical protein
MDTREERIFIETERYRLTGTIRLPRDGYRSRMTDYLNAFERGFLALTEVEAEPINRSRPPTHIPFVAVAVRHIVLAGPASIATVTNLTEAPPPNA